MAFIETIAPADAEGDVRSMYEGQQRAWGFVPNYAKVFCWRPEVMARWGRLLAEVRRPMDNKRFELVTFAAAHVLKHTGCSLAHGKALAGFVGDEAVRAIASGEDSDELSDADRAMVRFARKVALDASSVTSEDVDELRSHGLTDPEVFDIAATAAGRAFFTKLLDALGVEVEAGSGGMSRELRDMLTIGRAVDPRPPEVMPA